MKLFKKAKSSLTSKDNGNDADFSGSSTGTLKDGTGREKDPNMLRKKYCDFLLHTFGRYMLV